MGLDWKPMNRPKPGREKEYEDIFLTLQKKEETLFFSKLFGKKQKDKERLLESFFDMSIPAYETLDAPRVGFDDNATEWAKGQYEFREAKGLSLEEFLRQMYGYYVVELVPEHDGIPLYIAPHYEPHVFRAQFLRDCEQIIGERMLEMAYTSQLAHGAIIFGQQIMSIADDYAAQNNIIYLKYQRMLPDFDENSAESKAHIIFSAAKWLLWWGERGHGYEADF
jgi:hypothetical protein